MTGSAACGRHHLWHEILAGGISNVVSNDLIARLLLKSDPGTSSASVK